MRLRDGQVRYCLEWPVTEELPLADALLKGVQVDWRIYGGVGHGRWQKR